MQNLMQQNAVERIIRRRNPSYEIESPLISTRYRSNKYISEEKLQRDKLAEWKDYFEYRIGYVCEYVSFFNEGKQSCFCSEQLNVKWRLSYELQSVIEFISIVADTVREIRCHVHAHLNGEGIISETRYDSRISLGNIATWIDEEIVKQGKLLWRS